MIYNNNVIGLIHIFQNTKLHNCKSVLTLFIEDKMAIWNSLSLDHFEKKKYSNKLSMNVLPESIYVLVDSIFKIQIVLEWVIQQVIFRSSNYMYIKGSNRS